MPTYEYVCESCGKHFEMQQKMTEEPVETCPECGGKVRRVLSGGIGFIFNTPSKRRESCYYNSFGRTCCGREEPCDTRPCES